LLKESAKEKSRPSSANQDPGYNPLANQNEDDNDSVSELLGPRERVKRPFTALIDREIAKERSRSLSRGSNRSERSLSACSQRSFSAERSRSRDRSESRERSLSPGEGRPKFAYPDRIMSLGPLHEPVASSTHKSADIHAQLSLQQNTQLSAVHDSVQSYGKTQDQANSRKSLNDFVMDSEAKTQVRKSSKESTDDRQTGNNKVAFSDREEFSMDADGVTHSPMRDSHGGKMFNDPEYAAYYRKLSPGGRKRELLRQRQALMLEQERLRQVRNLTSLCAIVLTSLHAYYFSTVVGLFKWNFL